MCDEQKNVISISAVVPCYNRKETIMRCIDSILNQTYPIYEIVIVDDGSSDGTIELLEKNCGNNSKVKIIRQDHRGAQAARNMGIKAAQGEYIAFLDSDDEWMPDKLARQSEALIKNPNAVICTNGIVQKDWKNGIPKAYSASNRRSETKSEPLNLKGASGYVYKEIFENAFCLFPTLLTSKKNLMYIGMLDENVPSFQEWDTAIRLAKEFKFVYLTEPLFIYHLHDDETISKDTKKYIDGLDYIYSKYQAEIIEQLGRKGLRQKYKALALKCLEYKDKRIFKCFFKYIGGK